MEKEAEARSGRLIDQKYPARVLDPRREAVLLFSAQLHFNVRFWPLADIDECAAHVRFWGQSRHRFLREVAFAVAIRGFERGTLFGIRFGSATIRQRY